MINRSKDNVKNEREYNYCSFGFNLCLIRYNNCIISTMGRVSKVNRRWETSFTLAHELVSSGAWIPGSRNAEKVIILIFDSGAHYGWIQTLFLWILKILDFGISTISSDSQ